jgi:hypothetical protein
MTIRLRSAPRAPNEASRPGDVAYDPAAMEHGTKCGNTGLIRRAARCHETDPSDKLSRTILPPAAV